MDFKVIPLSDGKFQIVPANLVVLNPDMVGKRKHLFFVWAFPLDAPLSLDDVVEGKGAAPLCGYLSDHEEPWSYAIVERLVAQVCGKQVPSNDYDQLLKVFARELHGIVPIGEEWAFNICRCDCTGRKVPTCQGILISEPVRDEG